MASREDDGANTAGSGANQMGGGRGGEDTVCGGDDPTHPMGTGHAKDHINGLAVAVATISPHHQSSPLNSWQGLQNRLKEAFQVVGLLKHRSGSPQTGCAGLLVLEGCGQGDVTHLRGGGASGHGKSLLRGPR